MRIRYAARKEGVVGVCHPEFIAVCIEQVDHPEAIQQYMRIPTSSRFVLPTVAKNLLPFHIPVDPRGCRLCIASQSLLQIRMLHVSFLQVAS